MEFSDPYKGSGFMLFRQGILNSVDLLSLTSKFLPLEGKSIQNFKKAKQTKKKNPHHLLF
jgi:hypothetical protein